MKNTRTMLFSLGFAVVFGIVSMASTSYGLDLGGVAKGLLGGGKKDGQEAATGGKSADDMIAEALKELDNAKKLEEESNEIRKEMNRALTQTRFMQGVLGETLLGMYKTIESAGDEAVAASDKKGEEAGNLFQMKLPQQATLEESTKVAIQNKSNVDVLTEAAMEGAERFKQLGAGEIKSMKVIVNQLGLAIPIYQAAGATSQDVKQGIDNSMNMFFDKGKTVAVESVKMAVALGLQIKTMTDLIPQLKSDPLKGLQMVAQVKDIIGRAKDIMSVLQAYKADYDYIEGNSEIITQLGESVVAGIEKGKVINETVKSKMISIGENGAAIDEFVKTQKEKVVNAMSQKKKDYAAEGDAGFGA